MGCWSRLRCHACAARTIDVNKTGRKEKDGFTKAFLVTINGEGAASYVIDSALSLIGIHPIEVEDDGLTFA